MQRPRPTSGFTLLEMLVATGVFLFGFAAAYGLFLLGLHYRQQAEALTKASLATNALLDEFKLQTGLEPNAPAKPSAYVGDGFAGNGNGNDDINTLYPYDSMPGVWYCVTRCTDLTGGDDALTTTLHLTLVVAALDLPPATRVTFDELRRRYRMDASLNGKPEQIADDLVKRGLAFRFHSALLRRASWLPRA